MIRLEPASGARATIEDHARTVLDCRHAVFTWTLGEAIEATLDALSLPAGSIVAAPFSAPRPVLDAIELAGHRPRAVRTLPESLQLDPVALRQALADPSVAALVSWRPAGLFPPEAVLAVLASSSVPVIDALPRTTGKGPMRIPGAAATCLPLADGPSPAGLVATDDAELASRVGSTRAGGPALDRWAATTYAALHPGDAIGDARLAAGHELLVTTLEESVPGAHAVRASVAGWGGPPEVLLSLPDAGSVAALAEDLAGTSAIAATPWSASAPADWVERARDLDDACWRTVAVQLKLAPSAADVEAIAALDPGGEPSPDEHSAGDGSFGHDAPVASHRTARHVHQRFAGRAAKRAFDVVVGAALIVASSPVMVAVAALVWIRDGSPVIFRQVRVGRHGIPFEMLKFRTMVVEADERVGQLLERNERHGPLFKVDQDPRATTIGRMLRRASFDELPQLFNVVGGTMSLVGPRPALPRERVHFPPELTLRECVRPGLTGLWQVVARDDASFDRYAELDLEYVRNHDLRRDLEILARTPAAVLSTALRRPFGRLWSRQS